MIFTDPFLESIQEKINTQERLTADDALKLFQTDDLTGLGFLADRVNTEKNGKRVFFNINRHINPSNLCINRCQFCAYYRKSPEDKGAYELTVDEILRRISSDIKNGCKEVHIVGGLHPEWKFEQYVTIIQSIKEQFPDIHIKAFTCVEFDHFSKISGKSLDEVIDILKHAGLGSVPGGGAEIFAQRIRKKLCSMKISGERWLEVAESIHNKDLKSNATMLYGHIETLDERVDHLEKLRSLQDKTGGFQCFIPLSYHAENTELEKRLHIKGATGMDDLKTIAVSRLFLDNFQHIKAYWVMLGKKLAQVALSFGANDLDGTVVDETITFMAGEQTERTASISEITHLIKSSGKIPVERDTLYNIIRKY